MCVCFITCVLDEQIKIIAPIICYDWVDILRVIEPSFEGGDSFLRSVERRERQGGETDSAIFCLKKWIEQNPSANLLLAVCEAAEEANKRHLSENIAARFQDSALVGRCKIFESPISVLIFVLIY